MQWRHREVNVIEPYLGDRIDKLGDRLIGCVRSQGYSQFSGLGNWALVNGSKTTGRLVLGTGWHEGQLSFRPVDFVVGMRYTHVEMPMDLNFRKGH